MTTTTTSSVRTGCAIPGGRYNIFFVESIAIDDKNNLHQILIPRYCKITQRAQDLNSSKFDIDLCHMKFIYLI